MNGFSTVDGFVEITESLADMIKYVANEPSVGLFYVQQHTQHAVPNVVNLNNHVVKKSREATLHTEDLEDSITMVRSMKECGFPIADEMIKDIRNSLTLMSAKQPKRGLIHSPVSSFQIRRTSSWGPMSWGHGSGNAQRDGTNYFSTVIKSARQKASNFKWPQLESKEQTETKSQNLLPRPAPPLSVASASTSSIPDTEVDELPLSSLMADELHEEEEKEETEDDVNLSRRNLLLMSENYDDFKVDKEAKLEQWLAGTEGKMDKSKGESDTGGL
ncbi:uncharacterized protein LOC111310351 [Durio zibethinus]|uniref:Uncharacterized protein LOC111310351 n=1 Tax=Durio zibethinus TaxID=66656 RepID=A0A6P6AKU1_DURZI|nr:uncharacterized protein LOC111310351 [Durio zibethinus]XP_022765462.1 uncharacterized protein LOC111310351 [Durio zibethinus]